MKLGRRSFLHIAAGAAALPVTRFANAQAYPSRPVHLVVGFAPGGTSDVMARLVGQWLSKRLGQQFIVDNRPGASTNLATEEVVRALPDGHTLLVVGPSNAINATVYDKLSFNFLRDIAPVAGLASSPLVLEVHPSIPARTVPEFIAYAKANPGRLNLASYGVATISHVAGELFKMLTGINMVHVPYRGSAPMLVDLLAGQVQCAFDNLPASIEHIRAGRLRALAVTTAKRSDAMPELPTVGEFIPDFEVGAWLGLGAPSSTRAEVIARLDREVNAWLADPSLRARLAELGAVPMPMPTERFAKLVRDETAKWAAIVKFAGIKPE
jgi:tripartite-type tricarboxylate transporter receptor subunit TctC